MGPNKKEDLLHTGELLFYYHTGLVVVFPEEGRNSLAVAGREQVPTSI